MKKQLLTLSIAALLATPAAFAAYITPDGTANNGTDDDPDDIQMVTVSVPEVALLDVATGIVPIPVLAEPTSAGNGFAKYDANNDVASSFKLSSNVANTASPTLRKITVAVDTTVAGTTSIPEGATLAVSTSNAGAGGTALLTKASPSGETSVDIGNVATTTGGISYRFGATTADGMIAYTGDGATVDNIALKYTLSDD